MALPVSRPPLFLLRDMVEVVLSHGPQFIGITRKVTPVTAAFALRASCVLHMTESSFVNKVDRSKSRSRDGQAGTQQHPLHLLATNSYSSR